MAKASIGLLGLPAVGRAAYLLAVRYSLAAVRDRTDQLAEWEIRLDGALPAFVAGLGFARSSGRRRWERTAVGEVEEIGIFTAYPRVASRILRRVIPRFLRPRYVVSLTHQAGEILRWAAEGAQTETDREVADRLVDRLAGCRGLICLLDVNGELCPQLEVLEVSLLQVAKLRRRSGPVPVSLALTKCDTLRDRLPASDREWLEDPRHDPAKVDAFLARHEPAFRDRIAHIHRTTSLDVEPFLVSSWGGPPVRDEDGDEVVPYGHEIRPVRVLEPIRSVLDRLRAVDVRRRRRRAAALLFAALVLAAALWAWSRAGGRTAVREPSARPPGPAVARVSERAGLAVAGLPGHISTKRTGGSHVQVA